MKSVTVDGVTYRSLKSASQHFGMDYAMVFARVKRGWAVSDALKKPLGPQKGVGFFLEGREYKSIAAVAEHYGIPSRTLYSRLSLIGWTMEQAVGLEPRYDEACHGRVYVVSLLPSGRDVYVGQTVLSIEKRWQVHVSEAARGSERPISDAIRRLSPESFSVRELSTHETREELNAAEENAIKLLNTIAPNGFNLIAGGAGSTPARNAVYHGGIKYKSLAELCRALGLKYQRVYERLNGGWTIEDAVSKPPCQSIKPPSPL